MQNLSGYDHEVPKNIPLFNSVITLLGKRGTAHAIGIHVGTLHEEILETIITQAPLPDIKLVPLSMHQKNPLRFDKHVNLHEYICNNSYAI